MMGSSLTEKLMQNKLLLALVLSISIVAVLFYSVPAAAFWVGSTVATATQTSGTPDLIVSFQINKTTDEILNYSSIQAQLLYQDGSNGGSTTPTSCTPMGSPAYNYGYAFNSYGYGYDYSGYGYGYQSGYNFGETNFVCTFNFTIGDGKVAVGVSNVYVNGIMLGNSQSASGVPYLLFANNQVFSYAQINSTSGGDFNFTRQGETAPIMKVNVSAGTTVTLSNGSTATNVPLTIAVVPPSGSIDSGKAVGPVFQFGPAGATFSPAIRMVINYSLMTTAQQSSIVSLYDAGNLRMRRFSDAGVYVDDLTFTIDKTAKTITFSVDHFSEIVPYNGYVTPGGNGGSTSGSNSGGEVGAGSSIASNSENTSVYSVDVGSGKTCSVSVKRSLQSSTSESVLTTTLSNNGASTCVLSDFVFTDTIPENFAAMENITFSPAYASKEGYKVSFSFPSFAPGESKVLTYSVPAWVPVSRVSGFMASYTMSAKPIIAATPPATPPAEKPDEVTAPVQPVQQPSGQQQPQAPAAVAPPAKDNGILGSILTIAAILAAVAVVGGAVFFLVMKGKKKGL